MPSAGLNSDKYQTDTGLSQLRLDQGFTTFHQDNVTEYWVMVQTLGDQATGTMTCYPTQSHYPVTEPTILALS